LIEFLGNRGKKLVIGTTGFNEEQVTKIKKFGENNACVFSPNMSIGVNLLFSIVKNVASIIGERYDIEIIESHHNKKKDSPSGTAAKLAEVIADTLERNLDECGVYGRKGLVGERTKKEIGIHAVRAGDIVGEHTVMFAGPGERIELTHKAHTRDTFANGAVNAAVWLSEKNKGLFTMKEVLNLN
jgi:4-hydroxy-tetrahydrodipicolinate reductase